MHEIHFSVLFGSQDLTKKKKRERERDKNISLTVKVFYLSASLFVQNNVSVR